ncbi:hypothetical protein BV20DRAFT_1124905 [Pilatotrama ljubarskyi]|nr:hypothetical protein BV20DRAFT_1124905 [Pilatotrama ljubarskyi]
MASSSPQYRVERTQKRRRGSELLDETERSSETKRARCAVQANHNPDHDENFDFETEEVSSGRDALLALYRDEDEKEDYTDDHILDDDSLFEDSIHFAPQSDEKSPEDVSMTDVSNIYTSALPRPSPALSGVHGLCVNTNADADTSLDDEERTDIMEYINSSEDEMEAHPQADIISRSQRWRSPGPSPLFQDYHIDEPASNVRFVFDILRERYDSDEDETGYPIPMRRPSAFLLKAGLQATGFKSADRRARRIRPICRDHEDVDSVNLGTKLQIKRACYWLFDLPDNLEDYEGSELLRQFLQRRIDSFYHYGIPDLEDDDIKSPPSLGTPARTTRSRAQLNQNQYTYELVDSDPTAWNGLFFAMDAEDDLTPERKILVTFSTPRKVECATGTADEELYDWMFERQWAYPDVGAIALWIKSKPSGK